VDSKMMLTKFRQFAKQERAIFSSNEGSKSIRAMNTTQRQIRQDLTNCSPVSEVQPERICTILDWESEQM
jgi:hypothetical protein